MRSNETDARKRSPPYDSSPMDPIREFHSKIPGPGRLWRPECEGFACCQEWPVSFLARSSSSYTGYPARSGDRSGTQTVRRESAPRRPTLHVSRWQAASSSWQIRRTSGGIAGAAGRSARETGIPIRPWLENAAAEGRLRVLSTVIDPAHWYQTCAISATAGQRNENCCVPEERLEDRRPLLQSRPIRRLRGSFWRRPVTNAVTMLATTVGLAAATGSASAHTRRDSHRPCCSQLAAVIDCSTAKWRG